MRKLSGKAEDFSPQTLHLWLDEDKIEQIKEHTVRKEPDVLVSSNSSSTCAADLNNTKPSAHAIINFEDGKTPGNSNFIIPSDVRHALRPLPANTRQI